MTKPIINIDSIELQPFPPGYAPEGDTAERFDPRMCLIGDEIGAQKLGYNITALPPGKRAFPFHNHRVNEEMFFVLSGKGEIRIGEMTYPIRSGDIIACPPGGPETAHQIINNSDEELRYLAISTEQSPEIVEYPDSGKFGALANFTEADGGPRVFRFIGREEQVVDYWEGE